MTKYKVLYNEEREHYGEFSFNSLEEAKQFIQAEAEQNVLDNYEYNVNCELAFFEAIEVK